MPLVVLIWVFIIWIIIKRRQYLKQQEEDKMWRKLGEHMEREKEERKKLENSYTIDD